MLTLPGLIDVHVHLRTPGQEYKEDFYTGTQAALAGGFTTVLDMPNNKEPITTLEKLQRKIKIASQGINCDVGFYFGSLGNNLDEFEKVTSAVNHPGHNRHPELVSGSSTQKMLKQVQHDTSAVFGIKLYLNVTTGNFLIDEEKLTKIYQAWNSDQPILLHCEGETIRTALKIIRTTKKKTHICHVSSKEELSLIIEAKQAGLPLTCGVTPHHLFLTEEDSNRLGAYGLMKPFLKTGADVDFLWKNLDQIDVIESDHAPHTKEEKDGNPPAGEPPFGVPGLETTLPLLLTAVSDNRLSLDDVIRLCHINPARIFNIPTDNDTKVEVDENEKYEIQNEKLKTKCGWSPFAGTKVVGKVKKVILRGETVFEDGQVLVKPGFGKIIYPK